MRYILWLLCLGYAIPIPAADVPQQLYQVHQSVEQMASTMQHTIGSEFQTLLEDPNTISLRNESIYTEIYQTLKIQATTASQLTHKISKIEYEKKANDLMRQYVEKYPLSCFFECNSERCPLSRRNNPQFRNMFDQRIAERLTTMEAPVHYASIGSGGLLQDLRILGLALSQQPDLDVHIHLVDPWFSQHTPETEALYEQAQKLNSPTYFIEPKKESISAEVQAIFDKMRKISPPVVLETSHPIYQNTFMKRPMTQPQYFLYVLQSMYPNATITAHIYTSMQHYQQFINGIGKRDTIYRTAPPDIISISDIELGSTFEELSDTVMHILKENQQAHAIYLLSFLGKKTTFSEFSFSQFPGSQQYVYRNALSQIVPMPKPKTDFEDTSIYAEIQNLR